MHDRCFEHWLFVGQYSFFIKVVHGTKDFKVRHLDLQSEFIAMDDLVMQVGLDSYSQIGMGILISYSHGLLQFHLLSQFAYVESQLQLGLLVDWVYLSCQLETLTDHL